MSTDRSSSGCLWAFMVVGFIYRLGSWLFGGKSKEVNKKEVSQITQQESQIESLKDKRDLSEFRDANDPCMNMFYYEDRVSEGESGLVYLLWEQKSQECLEKTNPEELKKIDISETIKRFGHRSQTEGFKSWRAKCKEKRKFLDIESLTTEESFYALCGIGGYLSQLRRSENDALIESPKIQKVCNIKGNISFKGEKIYHLPGCPYYADTKINETYGERWFCSESEARAAGWRKAYNCY